MGKRRVEIAALVACLIFIAGWAWAGRDGESPIGDRPQLERASIAGRQVASLNVALRTVPRAVRFWYLTEPFPEVAADAEGLPLAEVDGQLWYHPWRLAQRGMFLVGVHERTGEAEPLALSVRHAEKLLGLADGGRFPYPFDFELYGGGYRTMRAPWYSAFGQGTATIFFLRLHDATGDPRWLRAADEAIAPMLDFDTGLAMAVDGFLWFEEYPQDGLGERVLNGHITSVLAAYEYFEATGKGTEWVRAGLATVAHYAEAFRQPGELSLYSLSDGGHASYDDYHRLHIRQLRALAEISGVAYFEEAAAALRSDGPG